MAKRLYFEAGKHRIDGVDIGVEDVLALLSAGMNINDIENRFPELSAEDIKACVQYALENIQ
ncbi:DUF433 domain-containing protein [Oceanicoccus sp. KOV_DT_Chl]|uniref:DUF433 domain-containing protein n=1 Tax=Oceanicoccus sp. KOV_DT_Chl TaxID=1904639 RepID=UPI00190EA506|nr:DUF433 domain-containing protein [Oceanicoccus sp. KOV_DT_Chl]